MLIVAYNHSSIHPSIYWSINSSIYSPIHPSIHMSWLLDLSIYLSIGQSAAFRHQYGWSYWLYPEADEYYGWVTSVSYAPLHSILHLQHANIDDTTGESIRLDVVTSSRDELNEVRSIVRALSEGNKVTRSLSHHLLYTTIFNNFRNSRWYHSSCMRKMTINILHYF